MFNGIGDLQVGELLLFSSQALLGFNADGRAERLGGWHEKLMIRPRLSKDGGASVVANCVDVTVANNSGCPDLGVTHVGAAETYKKSSRGVCIGYQPA